MPEPKREPMTPDLSAETRAKMRATGSPWMREALSVISALRARLSEVESELAAAKQDAERWHKQALVEAEGNEEREADLAAVKAERDALKESEAVEHMAATAEFDHANELARDLDAHREALALAARALRKLSVLGNEPFPGNSHGNVVAQEALAALDALAGRTNEGSTGRIRKEGEADA